MKKFLLSHFLFFVPYFLFSQNVGIGNNSPQTKLHITTTSSEVLRLDGNQPYLSLYSAGSYQGYFWKSPNSIEIGSAAGTNLPVTLAPDGVQRLFVSPSGNVGIGTITPTQKLEVNGASHLNGYVGIQNNNPNAPLSFAQATGKKITLNPGATGDMGISVQPGILEIHADQSSSDIAFGYEQSGTFFERMRVKGNGNVGIGTMSPSQKLHVEGGAYFNGSVNANTYLYNTPKTYYYSLSPTAFDGSAGGDLYVKSAFDISYFNLNAPPVSNFVFAPLQLPHGANIIAFEFFFTDNSATVDLEARLIRKDHILAAANIICMLNSTGTPGSTSLQLILPAPHTVNNLFNSYCVQVSAAGGNWPVGSSVISLRSVLITYTMDAAH